MLYGRSAKGGFMRHSIDSTSVSSALAAVLAASLATGCAKGPTAPDSRGMLTEENGQVRHLSEDEARTLCESQYCEPDYVQHTNAIGGATAKPLGLDGNRAIKDRMDYSRKLMGVPEAWAETLGSREVVVAVVDSGVDLTHPDLEKNLWINDRELNGKRGVDDDENGFIDDAYGYNFYRNRGNGTAEGEHGTHVAGIIGARLNGQGTTGVSPRVRIMPLTFIGPDGSGSTLQAIRAIDYAVANGADVISNSWGSFGRSKLLQNAIERARKKGIYVVAAAGNDTNENDLTPYFPASYPGVIAVGSSTRDDEMSDFSNFGRRSVEIFAPGSDIYSTVPGGGYAFMSGTSMAAPQVSGAIALALSLGKGTSDELLENRLCATARGMLASGARCGRLDVGEFVKTVAANL